ncbi:MAG TPA: hypothetical protein VHG72_18580 [Polyangia bacterium]|nr:hypothetical protein [Polyangia bacterium]
MPKLRPARNMRGARAPGAAQRAATPHEGEQMKSILCLGALMMLVGCDTSKADLESAKTTLASVTQERDNLKTQVTSLQQQLVTAQSDLAKEKAAETAATDKNGKATMAAASKTATPGAPAGKSKHAHKS